MIAQINISTLTVWHTYFAQMDDELADASFAGNDTFESLIEKYTDAADGKSPVDDTSPDSYRIMGAKGESEYSSFGTKSLDSMCMFENDSNI